MDDPDFVERRKPTPAEVAAAADRAAQLVVAATEKATQLAVERAVRDANVDRDIRDHEERLNAINGSQVEFAKSLARVEKAVDTLAEKSERSSAVTEALSQYVEKQSSGRFSKWTIIVGVVTAIAAYGGLVVVLVAGGHT